MERGHRSLSLVALALALAAAPAYAKKSKAKPAPPPPEEKSFMTEATERARRDYDPEACLVGAEIMAGFPYSDVDPADERQLMTYYGDSFSFWFSAPQKKGHHTQRFCQPVGSTPPKGGFGPKLCFGGFDEWWSDDQDFMASDTPCIRSVRVPIAQALELGAKKNLQAGETGLLARLMTVTSVDAARKKLLPLKGKTVWLLRGQGADCLAVHVVSGKQLYFGPCEALPW